MNLCYWTIEISDELTMGWRETTVNDEHTFSWKYQIILILSNHLLRISSDSFRFTRVAHQLPQLAEYKLFVCADVLCVYYGVNYIVQNRIVREKWKMQKKNK